MSQRFGVQKLVLLNSGRFRFAEFDLTCPAHLAADNNSGKSTLVNALQFLFVDAFDKMEFGDHDLASTRRHYFGQAPSYIVFECRTQTGPQCLVVVGSGEVGQFRFSRIVYRGTFNREHYMDASGRLADPALLRQRLLGADVLEVRQDRLWRVLCCPSDLRGEDEESARFGILPLKRVEDYRSFREVFIRLLRLSRATADDLKRLLIACACQSIRATSVDVKREYEDQFDRLERNDLELQWLKAIVPLIDEGLRYRAGVSEIKRRIGDHAIDARKRMRLCTAIERRLIEVTEVQRVAIAARLRKLQLQRDELSRALGGLTERLNKSTGQLAELDAAQQRWGSVTDLELMGWKTREDELHRIIHETKAKLKASEAHDLPSLVEEHGRKQQEVERRVRELEEWDHRTAGYLDGLGFSPKEIGLLFRLINPDLGRSSHAKVFGSSQPDLVKALVHRTLAAHRDESFNADGVSINTSNIQVSNDLVSQTRDAVVQRLGFVMREFEQVAAVLGVARDLKATHEGLKLAGEEVAMFSAKMREYLDHGTAYARRPLLVGEIATLQRGIKESENTIAGVDREQEDCSSKLADLNLADAHRKQWENCRSHLQNQLGGIEISDELDESDGGLAGLTGDAIQLKDQLQQEVSRLNGISGKLAILERERSEQDSKLSQVQHNIAAQARQRRARVAVFDQDVSGEWMELERLKEALPANEQQLAAQWNAMFKSLAGQLDLLRRSVAEVKKRSSRINSDLKRYGVSNLEMVELHIDHDTSAYLTIERMTETDSIFLSDRDSDDARRELRQWIMDGKTIELRDLFSIRIRIQDQGAERPTDVASLDVIGSEGTGMTAKVMIYLQLLRSIIDDERNEYQMHFYLDEIGRLDDHNLQATSEMAFRRGFIPITAEPKPRADGLGYPEFRIYHLGMHGKSFEIVQQLTTVAHTKRSIEKASK